MQVDKAQIMEMTSEENPEQPAAEYVANDDDHQYIYFGYTLLLLFFVLI